MRAVTSGLRAEMKPVAGLSSSENYAGSNLKASGLTKSKLWRYCTFLSP